MEGIYDRYLPNEQCFEVENENQLKKSITPSLSETYLGQLLSYLLNKT